jgi:hypothetical protein
VAQAIRRLEWHLVIEVWSWVLSAIGETGLFNRRPPAQTYASGLGGDVEPPADTGETQRRGGSPASTAMS